MDGGLAAGKTRRRCRRAEIRSSFCVFLRILWANEEPKAESLTRNRDQDFSSILRNPRFNPTPETVRLMASPTGTTPHASRGGGRGVRHSARAGRPKTRHQRAQTLSGRCLGQFLASATDALPVNAISSLDAAPIGQQLLPMPTVVEAPKPWVASVGRLSLPRRADLRLQSLTDRNNEGLLTREEREEFESLVEWSEEVSLLRAQALRLLGKRPT